MPVEPASSLGPGDAVHVGSTVEIADHDGRVYSVRVEAVSEISATRFRVTGVVRAPHRFRSLLATGVTDADGRAVPLPDDS